MKRVTDLCGVDDLTKNMKAYMPFRRRDLTINHAIICITNELFCAEWKCHVSTKYLP